MFIEHRAASPTPSHHGRMPARLHRYYGAAYLHLITTSCFQRQPWLSTAHSRDLFLRALEQYVAAIISWWSAM
jgi:hypothetical protein